MRNKIIIMLIFATVSSSLLAKEFSSTVQKVIGKCPIAVLALDEGGKVVPLSDSTFIYEGLLDYGFSPVRISETVQKLSLRGLPLLPDKIDVTTTLHIPMDETNAADEMQPDLLSRVKGKYGTDYLMLFNNYRPKRFISYNLEVLVIRLEDMTVIAHMKSRRSRASSVVLSILNLTPAGPIFWIASPIASDSTSGRIRDEFRSLLYRLSTEKE